MRCLFIFSSDELDDRIFRDTSKYDIILFVPDGEFVRMRKQHGLEKEDLIGPPPMFFNYTRPPSLDLHSSCVLSRSRHPLIYFVLQVTLMCEDFKIRRCHKELRDRINSFSSDATSRRRSFRRITFFARVVEAQRGQLSPIAADIAFSKPQTNASTGNGARIALCLTFR